jgi:O-antigen/teichoic acid export membrane protein
VTDAEPTRPPTLRPLQALLRSRVFAEASWVAVTRVLAIGGRLVGVRLITGLVAPGVYAEFVLLAGVAMLGNHVFCAPILHGTLRFLPDARVAGRIQSLRNLIVRLLTFRTALLVLALCVGGAIWIQLRGMSTTLPTFLLLAAVLVVDVYQGFETNLLNAMRRQASCGLWAASDAWMRAFSAAGAILVFGPSAASILSGYFIGGAAVSLAFRLLVVRTSSDPVEADPGWATRVRPDILRYAAPLIPLAILGWIVNMSDRYILAELAGADTAGIYSAAYGIASQPFVAAASVSAITLRPILFDAVTADDRRKERRAVLLWIASLGAVFALGLVVVALFSDFIVQLVLGEAFRGGSTLLVWIGAAYSVIGIQQVFTNMILAQRRTKRLLVVHASAAAAALVLYFLLIPTLGARGAAIATLIATTISLVVAVVVSNAPRRLAGITSGGSGYTQAG